MESECDGGQQLVQRLRQLGTKANAGDPQALFNLRTLLADDPRIVEHLGDLSRHIECTLLEKLAPEDAVTRESVREYLTQLRVQLAGKQPTALERLLIDQVCLNYLAASQAAFREAGTSDSCPQLSILRAKRAESSHKRLLASIKLLTTLRAFAPQGLVPVEPYRQLQHPKLSA